MRATHLGPVLCLCLAAAGCGKPEEPPKPEDTVFGDYVTAPGKVQDRTDAAMEEHRKALESRIEESEAPPAEPEPE